MVTGAMIDYIEFDDGFSIARTRAPRLAAGRTLLESGLRARFGVTVVGVKRRGEDFTYARPETMVYGGALLIVAGRTPDVQRFSAVT